MGESGKKIQKITAANKVMMPVMTINHCQGRKPGVRMWRQPKASKPKKMMAVPFMRTGNGRQKKSEWVADERETYTNIRSSESARRACRTLRLPEAIGFSSKEVGTE